MHGDYPSSTVTLSRIFTILLLLCFGLGQTPPPTVQAGNESNSDIASAGEITPENPDNAVTTVDLPSSASADWWTTVQKDIRQSEYHVTWQEQTYLSNVAAAYQAPNRAHNLRTYFTSQGIRLIPRAFEEEEPPWEWALTLIPYGYASSDSLRTGPSTNALDTAPQMTTDANYVEYRYATRNSQFEIVEWYVNDERGLEQGFTLPSPPLPTGEGPLVLELAISGGLTPHLIDDGTAIEFTTPGGVTVLRYGDLFAYDAAHRPLPARLDLAGSAIRISLNVAGAVYPITVDPLITSPIWTAESDQGGSQYGFSVGTAGDVNGDGYDDVIVGAPSYDGGDLNEGRAYVYYGSANGLASSPSWIAESDLYGAQFGRSVGTAGDVNGDGYDDVIIGAQTYHGGQSQEGRAFVYYGSADGLGTAPWTAEIDQAGAHFGSSVGTAGDVNGDGYDDVIIGAPYYNVISGTETISNAGMAVVYHGSGGGLSSTAAWTAEGEQASAFLGTSVGTAGDVNGDGHADVIVGVPEQALVYYGGDDGLATIAAWAETGTGSFGNAVGTAGDVNGDGYDDVIIGAPGYANPESGEGAAFVYHGSASGPADTPSWSAESNVGSALFGYAVGTAGDINGDGYADVIVGAYLYTGDVQNEGRAYVYYGSETGVLTTAAWSAESGQYTAYYGISVGTAGDVNGDGYSDIVVGAHGHDTDEADVGRAYVYYGNLAGIRATADWAAEGNQEGATFGYPVSTAGDVNGDGYSDVIIGSWRYDNGQEDEGRVYVYHGSRNGLASSPAWTAEGGQDSARFGHSARTAGDVNGDGYADVIIGAPLYDFAYPDEGQVYVYLGSATGLAATPSWTARGDQTNAELGKAAGTAGDVNGDGYSDVIVDASFYDNGETDEGRVFVYHGSATGLGDDPAWDAESDQAEALFGAAVGAAGDVNGDGYDDVVVGAEKYDNGETDEGAVFVYHGSASGLSTSSDWTAEGDQNAARFGNAAGTAGDVNGDGYADLIVGAYYYDNGHSREGRAFVYYGAADGLSTAHDWSAEGDQANAYFGNAVATAGDVNGDGYSDIIVGAKRYDIQYTDEGRVTVYHGAATGLSASSVWWAKGDQAGALFGNSVGTAGDVNGDGYSDIIVGATHYDNGEEDEGRVTVYHGGDTGLSTTPGWLDEPDQDEAYFGAAVNTAGDVNGDGYADVIVGAYGYDNGTSDEGAAFVYHGSASGPSPAADWTVEGEQASSLFGVSVGTAGDVNGDGYSDVIVGARFYDVISGTETITDAGAAFVYYGAPAGLSSTADWTAYSNQQSSGFGFSVSTAGDVNGDGYADVVVGAPTYDDDYTDQGRAFVYHGSASGLSPDPDWFAQVTNYDARFGKAVSTAGDVNGDGYSDVIVSAYGFSRGEQYEGAAFVYHGSAIGLSASPDWEREGNQADLDFGWSVATAGDVNGDGYADVAVGARRYTNGESEEGAAFVYHGSASGLNTDADWIAEGNEANLEFDWVSTAGDVNGDGYADVIVGGVGKAAVYYGADSGLTITPTWSESGDGRFGAAVSTAGDVNGDGYSDVIVGAFYYDNVETDEGAAFVYYGNGGTGLYVLPRQMRSDGSTPIAPLGRPDSGTEFQISLIGRMPLGREDVRVEWQVAPLGVPFTATTGVTTGTTAWTDVLTTGVEISSTITGLAPGTPYHWRARLLYRPGNVMGQPAGRWVHIPWGGWNETDLRTGLNLPPTANAGTDQTVSTNEVVALDGSGSSDPDGDLQLDYCWAQTGGPTVTLDGSTVVTPTFTAPGDPAVLTFTLTVTDSLGLSAAPDTVVITVTNQPPVANAGSDQSVNTNETVGLDGSGSNDPDGDLPLVYYWEQTGGPTMTLDDPAVVTPTFTAPDDPAVLTFTLTTTDSLGLAALAPDEVVVTVGNQPPVADAGSGQTVAMNTTVTLDGSGSSDPDGDLPLDYYWEQIGGSPVALSDPTVVTPTFEAPADPAVLTFTLVITDSLGLPDPTPDEVVIAVGLHHIYLPLVIRH